MAANTATVLRAQRRLTNTGVTKFASTTWIASSAAGAPTIRGQSSKVISATSATTAIVTAEPINGTKPATPISAPQMMALGKPTTAERYRRAGGDAGVDHGEGKQVLADPR